jgi:hypothetical protein
MILVSILLINQNDSWAVQRAEITKLFVEELRQEIGMHDTTSASIEGRFAWSGLDLLSCYLVIVSTLHTI